MAKKKGETTDATEGPATDATEGAAREKADEKAHEKAREKAREKWMARFQVRLAMQPGVDRTIVLRAVKEVTAHCAETGEDPQTAFGDPDAYAVQVAERLVPADRAAQARRYNSVAGRVSSALKRVRDAPGP